MKGITYVFYKSFLYVYLLVALFIVTYWQDSIVVMDNSCYTSTFIVYSKTLGRPLNAEKHRF